MDLGFWKWMEVNGMNGWPNEESLLRKLTAFLLLWFDWRIPSHYSAEKQRRHFPRTNPIPIFTLNFVHSRWTPPLSFLSPSFSVALYLLTD
jgi:hypothetical protein